MSSDARTTTISVWECCVGVWGVVVVVGGGGEARDRKVSKIFFFEKKFRSIELSKKSNLSPQNFDICFL